MDQLFATGGRLDRNAIPEGRGLLPPERNATERGDQRRLALAAINDGLHACARPVRRLDRGRVSAGDLRHRRVVLACQRLEQRGDHHPAQLAQPVDVAGQQVVLDDAAVLGAVLADDRVVLLVHQLGPSLGFAPLHVPRAFGRDHLPGHAQPDPAVDRPAASGELSIVVLDDDLVAEEPRRAGAGVGDQRLGLRQLQREFVVQELTEATFDLLSFGSWAGEPEQDVICVADVTQPPIVRIARIQTREPALLLAQGLAPRHDRHACEHDRSRP
jgi:hypothetical protein